MKKTALIILIALLTGCMHQNRQPVTMDCTPKQTSIFPADDTIEFPPLVHANNYKFEISFPQLRKSESQKFDHSFRVSKNGIKHFTLSTIGKDLNSIGEDFRLQKEGVGLNWHNSSDKEVLVEAEVMGTCKGWELKKVNQSGYPWYLLTYEPNLDLSKLIVTYTPLSGDDYFQLQKWLKIQKN